MKTSLSELKPAEIYDRKFVPALFGQWGPVITDIAGVSHGMAVLDVGCGTGALTLAVADAVGPDGEVIGLDVNPEMLAVAQMKPADIQWEQGVAEDLPFEDNRFEAVVSQFAFMFFEDGPKALTEMMRVVKPAGTVAVAVCGNIGASPGYSAFAGLLDRLFGSEVGDAFRAPFVLGDTEKMKAIARAANIDAASIEERNGLVKFGSIDELVSTERACVWTLGGILDDGQFELLQKESREVLRPFADEAGTVMFDMPALVLKFRKQ